MSQGAQKFEFSSYLSRKDGSIPRAAATPVNLLPVLSTQDNASDYIT